MNELGGDKAVTASLLALKLPITFSVLPFAKDAAATATAAHEAGQEVLVDMPMETVQSPFVKAGPGEITTKMSEEDMRILMDDALGHVPYATGASNFMGSRLTTDTAATRRFCEILARSGLYVLDDVTHQESILYAEARRRGLPAWRRALTLNDGPKTEGAVLADLKKAEETARAKGHAVVIATPAPHVLAALKRWSQERDKDIRLVPLRLQPVEEDVCLSILPTAGRSRRLSSVSRSKPPEDLDPLWVRLQGGWRFPTTAEESSPFIPVPDLFRTRHFQKGRSWTHRHPSPASVSLHRLRQHGRAILGGLTGFPVWNSAATATRLSV
ncbi:MAG: divergent polysaccharide deacetylase family protein [Bilophila wadsworthia]